MCRWATAVALVIVAVVGTLWAGFATAQSSAQAVGGPFAFVVSADIGFASAPVGAPEIDRVGVKLDAGGFPGLCHPLTEVCGRLGPTDLLFSAQVLIGELARIDVWSLADVPSHALMHLDGTPCSDDDACSLGVGFLLLLSNAAGEPLAGHAELGIEDFDRHFSQARVFAAPGESASIFWLETLSFCGGGCERYEWSDWRLRGEPGYAPLTVRAGPYASGVVEVELRESPDGSAEVCRMVRRTEPTYDALTGFVTLVHSFELLGDDAQTQTISYSADGMVIGSTSAAADATQVPQAVQTCEPAEAVE